MKKLWALRHVFGMLLAFGISVALLAAATTRYPLYVGAAVLLLVGWIVAIQPRAKKERERTRTLVEDAFRAAYAQRQSPPSIVFSSSYGYPAFEIKFHSRHEMEDAATQNEFFKSEIDRIFAGHGPKSRPFSADLAIFFTYDGYLDELRTRLKTA